MATNALIDFLVNLLRLFVELFVVYVQNFYYFCVIIVPRAYQRSCDVHGDGS